MLSALIAGLATGALYAAAALVYNVMFSTSKVLSVTTGHTAMLGGVFGAALRLFPWYRDDLVQTPFYANEPVSQTVSLVLFVALCAHLWWHSLHRKLA